MQHVDDVVGDILLYIQHPQRTAALGGALEGGGNHVVHHLFRQGCAVHQHHVQPAGLGDEWHDGALALCQGLVDRTGSLGAAGKGHAGLFPSLLEKIIRHHEVEMGATAILEDSGFIAISLKAVTFDQLVKISQNVGGFHNTRRNGYS